jgi:phosphatidylglycerophosphate synthase
MLDRLVLNATRPIVDRAARALAARGIGADQVTFAALGLGLIAALLIVLGFFTAALVPLLAGRLLDGLDGAVARAGTPSDRGAFLDISCDFIFYASIPLAFAVADPAANALAAAALLAAFLGTGTSFLAYAILAEKRGLKSTAYPSKSFYYLGGLTEGTETVASFAAMGLWPQHFSLIAYIFAALCVVTILTRVAAGWQVFGSSPS